MKHLLFVVVAVVSTAFGQLPSAIAIRNAKVVHDQRTRARQSYRRLRNGLIEAVDENATIALDAWVLEGDGLTVYPGLIGAMSNWGIASGVSW